MSDCTVFVQLCKLALPSSMHSRLSFICSFSVSSLYMVRDYSCVYRDSLASEDRSCVGVGYVLVKVSC